VEQVRKRIGYVNDLYRNGHEIASHAVGHFNGAAWSAADWQKEFRAFGDIVDNVGPNNGLESKLAFTARDVIGFRAPYLAKSAGLYGALKANGFRYDTSGVAHDAWPERIDGIWRFTLAIVWMQGSGRGILSMDYFRGAVACLERSAPLRARAREESCNRSHRPGPTTPETARRCTRHHFMNYQAAPTTRH
jgi:hypothetical protein